MPKGIIPQWIKISDYNFKELKKEVDEGVAKNLGPIPDNKKVTYLLYKISYKTFFMENLTMQKKQNNITTKIFMKNMGKK